MSEFVLGAMFGSILTAHFILLAMACAYVGKSPFWTGYYDVITLRILWRRFGKGASHD